MAFIKNQIIKRLEKFIKNLSTDMLSISLVKGEAKLSDVKIDEVALMDVLKLPRFIKLNSAICNEVFIKIPWTKLKSEPIYLAFDCVEVKISLDQGTDSSKNIVDSIMESANNTMQNMNMDPGNPMAGSGGLIDKIIEGVKMSINTLLVTVISYNFRAVIEITSVMIQSTTPTWKPGGLKFSRISMKELGTYIHFKEIQWSNMRVEVRIIRQGSESPLKIITNQTKLRVTTQKFLPGNVTNNLTPLVRMVLVMEDLLWVINESQIAEVIIFLSTCLQVSNDFQSRLTAKPYNPGPLIAYNSAPFVIKTSEKYVLFQRYQVLEESMHLWVGKIDFHLCQNLTNLNSTAPSPDQRSNENPKSLQVIVEEVSLDIYPRHYTHMSRDHWLEYRTSDAPSKPHRWTLTSLQDYWNDLEILLRLNGDTSHLRQRDPIQQTRLPPPSLRTPTTQDQSTLDTDLAISALMSRARSHLLQKCAVLRVMGDLRILDLSLYESSTDHGLILAFERDRFNLPRGQPLVHIEANDYFYYSRLDFSHFLPVPSSSLFVEANPLKVICQYESLSWLAVLVSRVSALWKIYYTDQCSPIIPRFHTDVYVQSLMPRMIFPKYYYPHLVTKESPELSKCYALQCQASEISIGNFTLIGDPPPSPTPTAEHRNGIRNKEAILNYCVKEIDVARGNFGLGPPTRSTTFPETPSPPQDFDADVFRSFYPPGPAPHHPTSNKTAPRDHFRNLVADRRHLRSQQNTGGDGSLYRNQPRPFSTLIDRLPQTTINSSDACKDACRYLYPDTGNNSFETRGGAQNMPPSSAHTLGPKCLWNLAWADRWTGRIEYFVIEREEEALPNSKDGSQRNAPKRQHPLFGPMSCQLWLSPGPVPGHAPTLNEPFKVLPINEFVGFEDVTLRSKTTNRPFDHTTIRGSMTSPGAGERHHRFYYQVVVKIGAISTKHPSNAVSTLKNSFLEDQKDLDVNDGDIVLISLDNAKYGSLLLLTESLSIMSNRISELEATVPALLVPPSINASPNGSLKRDDDQSPPVSRIFTGQVVSVKMTLVAKLVVFKFFSDQPELPSRLLRYDEGRGKFSENYVSNKDEISRSTSTLNSYDNNNKHRPPLAGSVPAANTIFRYPSEISSVPAQPGSAIGYDEMMQERFPSTGTGTYRMGGVVDGSVLYGAVGSVPPTPNIPTTTINPPFRSISPDRFSLDSYASLPPGQASSPAPSPGQKVQRLSDSDANLVLFGGGEGNKNLLGPSHAHSLIFPFLSPSHRVSQERHSQHAKREGGRSMLQPKKLFSHNSTFTKGTRSATISHMDNPYHLSHDVDVRVFNQVDPTNMGASLTATAAKAEVEVGEDLLESPIFEPSPYAQDFMEPKNGIGSDLVGTAPPPFLTFALRDSLLDIDIVQVVHDMPVVPNNDHCERVGCQDRIKVAFKLWAQRGFIRDGTVVKMLSTFGDKDNVKGEHRSTPHPNDPTQKCFLKFRASFSSIPESNDTADAQHLDSTPGIRPSTCPSTIIQVSALTSNLDSGDSDRIRSLAPGSFRNLKISTGTKLRVIPLSPFTMEQFSELFTFSGQQLPPILGLENAGLVSPFSLFAHVGQPIAVSLLSTPVGCDDPNSDDLVTERHGIQADNFDLLLRPVIAYRLGTDGILVLTNPTDIAGEVFESLFTEMIDSYSSHPSPVSFRLNPSPMVTDTLLQENRILRERVADLELAVERLSHNTRNP